MFIIGLIVGLLAGTVLGALTFALCVAASDADDRMEENVAGVSTRLEPEP